MNDQLIEILQRALALEYAGVMTYNRFAATLQGIERAAVGEVFSESATESLAHASTIMQWIIFLAGDVTAVGNVDDADTPEAPLNGDVRGYLKWAIEHESTAIEAYKAAFAIVEDVAVQDWLQEQIQTETKDLIGFKLLAAKY